MLKVLGIATVAGALCTIATAQSGVAAAQPPLPERVSIAAVEQVRVNGVALAVRTLHSDLSPEALLAAFQNTWAGEHAAAVAPIARHGEWRILGARRGHWFDTLQLREREQAVEARVSTIDLTARVQRGSSLPVPLPPASVLLSQVEFGAQPAPETQWLLQSSWPSSRLASWLQARLQGAGWRVTGPSPATAGDSVRSYERGGSVLTAAVTRAPDPATSEGSAITLLLQRKGAR